MVWKLKSVGTSRRVSATVLAASILSPGAAYAGLSYRLDWVPTPDGVTAVDAADINDRGQVVGTSLHAAEVNGYTWSRRGGFVTLARIATAEWMTAVAINERGIIAGNAQWSDGTSHPVVWSDPTRARDLGVHGVYSFESPDSSWSYSSATASAINRHGHVAGSTSSAQFAEVAYLWKPQQGMKLLGTLPGGRYSRAWGVNSADEVVGSCHLPEETLHACVWSRGRVFDLGALDGSYSEGYAINDLGEVAGIYQTPAGETRVFRWTRSRGMVDVGPTYPNVGEGITSLATRNNLLGQIVGGIQPPGSSIRAAVRQPFTGAWQELMPGASSSSFALGTNTLGVIVGRVHPPGDTDDPSRAAVWTPVYTFP